jgi:stage II sporulation protein M
MKRKIRKKEVKKMKNVKKGKVQNFFSENYSKSWEYIKESKNFIWAAVIIFFAAVIIGFLFQPPSVINIILDYIKKVLAETEGISSYKLVSFIFFNNLQIGFMGLIYGFVLGIFPVLSIFANGYVVGYVTSFAISSAGAGSLLNLLPHGIFELPAIFISFGMGIKFGTFIFYKEKMKYFGKFFIDSLRVFVFVVLPLLIIAAIIEGSLISLLK